MPLPHTLQIGGCMILLENLAFLACLSLSYAGFGLKPLNLVGNNDDILLFP